MMPAPAPGVLVFCQGKGVLSRGIRVVQHIAGDMDWQDNHVAIVDRPTPGGGGWYVIQAEASGVTDTMTLVELAARGTFTLVPPPAGTHVFDMLDFARAQVGDEYGFPTDASILV